MDNELKGEGNSVNYRYRMHDPRVGRFFAVDPLQKAFHWNSSYAFSENRVIDAFELEGAESVLLHGTLAPFENPYELWNREHLRDLAIELTGNDHHISGIWSGRGENPILRKMDAALIASKIIAYRKEHNLIREPIFIMGHSHGGNVGQEVINYLNAYYENTAENINKPHMILLTLNTPKVRETKVKNYASLVHYNIYSNNDFMSSIGQIWEGIGNKMLGQEYPNAINISYEDQTEGIWLTWNHMGIWPENYAEWKPKLDEERAKINNRIKVIIENIKSNPNTIKEKAETVKDNTNIKSPRYF